MEAGSQDLGGGTYTIMTQIAADVLGVPVSRVTFRLGDTRYPETPVSGGSQTAATNGPAVFQAATMLKDKLTRMTQAEIAAQPYIEAEASKGEIPMQRSFRVIRSALSSPKCAWIGIWDKSMYPA